MANKKNENEDQFIAEVESALVKSDEAQARDKYAERDELLADMPMLRKPHHLRIRHQNRFLEIQMHLRPLLTRLADKDGNIDLDLNTVDDKTVLDMMEGAALIDEFAESIAFKPEEYAKWAQAKSPEYFWAIFAQYAEAQGN